MFDFFDKLEDKIAFKIALNKVKEESGSSTKAVQRVYHNNVAPDLSANYDVRLDDKVDTQYFKEYETEESVIPESKSSKELADIYEASENKASQTRIVASTSAPADKIVDNTQKKSFMDMLKKDDDLKFDSGKADMNFNDYLKNRETKDLSKQNLNSEQNVVKNSAPVSDIAKQEQIDNKQTKDKLDLEIDRIINSVIESSDKKSEKVKYEEPDIEPVPDYGAQITRKPETKKTPSTNVIINQEPKTEVKQEVKPDIIKEPKPEKLTVIKKPATKRRTRGKAKRKFDADVITYVDWRD